MVAVKAFPQINRQEDKLLFIEAQTQHEPSVAPRREARRDDGEGGRRQDGDMSEERYCGI